MWDLFSNFVHIIIPCTKTKFCIFTSFLTDSQIFDPQKLCYYPKQLYIYVCNKFLKLQFIINIL